MGGAATSALSRQDRTGAFTSSLAPEAGCIGVPQALLNLPRKLLHPSPSPLLHGGLNAEYPVVEIGVLRGRRLEYELHLGERIWGRCEGGRVVTREGLRGMCVRGRVVGSGSGNYRAM